MTGSNLKKTNVVNFKFLKPCLGALLLACASPTCVSAQLEDFLANNPIETAEKTPAEIRTQLLLWRKEAKSEMEGLSRLSVETGLPAGINATDLNTRKRHLEQILLGITRHLSNLDGIVLAKQELEDTVKASQDWSGFEARPPYSILLLDEFTNRKVSAKEKLKSYQSSIDIFNTNTDIILADWKKADAEAADALVAYQEATAERETAHWHMETSQAKKRSLSIRISSFQSSIALTEVSKKTAGVELALLERQIAEVAKKSIFSEEDLNKIRKASLDRQSSLRKEIAAIQARQTKVVAERKRAKSFLDSITTAENPDTAATELASLRLESADTRSETMQAVVELLESFEQLESFVPEAYEHRFELLNAQNAPARKVSLESLIALNKRLEAWEIISKNELSSVAADINRQEARATALPAEDPRLAPLAEQRSVLWEKQAVIQRARQSVTNQRELLARWISSYGQKEKPSWHAPISNLAVRSLESMRNIWNVPVTEVKETTEIDGQTVERTRSVKLGTVIIAILLFVATYYIAAIISRRFQRIVVHRNFIGENQARTLRNWMMLVVGFLLALATLSWLSIPLTVFAFLAGALAIGVGFGTQTIIKNFISGIILLFERKVRVGDIVEVDGTLGVVSEINTRSSIVRGFNGIENLIPNSLFLENRVVNWTLNSRFLRKELTLGVAYGSPPQKVIDILLETAERHGLILKDPAPFAVFSQFGESCLDFTMYYWIELNDKTNSLIVGSDLCIMIEKKLAEAKIDVPYPHRDVRLSSEHPIQVEVIKQAET